MSERPRLEEIGNPGARLDELRVRLERSSDEVALASLFRSLDDPYPPIRHFAARALAEHFGERVVAVFRAVLRHDVDTARDEAEALGVDASDHPDFHDEQARQAACIILAADGTDESTNVLLEATDAPSADVRYQALVALHDATSVDEELRRAVEPRLEDPDSEVATVAAQLIAERGWTDLLDAVLERWERETGQMRIQFALSLAELIGVHEATVSKERFDALHTQLTDALEDEETVAAAARALVTLGDEHARGPLREVLDRWLMHPILKVEAAAALVELGDKEGRSYLGDALEHRRRDVRGYALRTIGRLRLDEYYDELVATARGDDYHADTSVIALADWGSDAAVEVLEELSDGHPDSEVARLAARCLEEMRRPGDFQPDTLLL